MRLLSTCGIVVALLTALLSPVGSAEALSRAPVMCLGRLATAVGTARNDLLVGGPGQDVIAGRGGADVIRGRRGPDLLCGGPGNDLLVGGRGRDVLDGGGGGDDLRGQKGRDDLIGGPGSDVLRGGSGRDGLFGGAGGDLLLAGADDDLLFGGPGGDDLRGGPDSDLASFAFSSGPVEVDLSSGLADGEGLDVLSSVERLEGSDHDDVLHGDQAWNRIAGGRGDDMLVAGSSEGGDTEVLEGGPGHDTLDGGPGEDEASFLTAQAGVDADLAVGAAIGDGADTVIGIEDLTGSAFDDSLRGDDGPNRLSGHFGDDVLEGGDGVDSLSGGPGFDVADGGAGQDLCLDVEDPISCEFELHGDPAPFTTITRPLHGQTIDTVRRVVGRANDGPFGEVESVDAAVRLLTPAGCLWLRDSRSRLEHRPCAAPLWNGASLAGGPGAYTWSLRFAPLPTGRYQAWSRAVGTLGDFAYREMDFLAGWNLADFRVT